MYSYIFQNFSCSTGRISKLVKTIFHRYNPSNDDFHCYCTEDSTEDSTEDIKSGGNKEATILVSHF